ncbi:carbohydrate ABC transporter permease [Halalkalibacter flavus]|jgi:cellobiose transport system permease protein|uniref:carbohydrate ABC transporter permease n=1 Tax=Halalkalibacter flavus TaxID=3090668 RepID=UPI002FC88945
MNEAGQRKLPKIALYLFLGFTSILSVFPFYWMFVIGSNTNSEVNKIPPVLLPGEQFMTNVAKVFERIDFFGALWNSFVISTAITFFVLFFSSLAGYAFAKIEFKGKKFFFIFLLATMMVPPQLGLIPSFMIISSLGWVDTLQAVIVPGMVSAFGVFFMRQYVATSIPNDLIEAAKIDGCNHLRIYWNIIVPAIKPAFATLGIITYMNAWNDFLWPLIVLKDSSVHTIQIALRTLNDAYTTDYPMVLAGTFLATIPILIVFLIFNRQFIAGITEGAVKS